MQQVKLFPNKNKIYTDTAFQDNKELPFHRWVNWIAGFSELFVNEAINRHLPKGNRESLILDPFSGVGTTPVTSYLRGCSALGYEINAFPAFVARMKYKAIHDLDLKALNESIAQFAAFMQHRGAPSSNEPPGFRTRIPFYSPQVLKQVLRFWDYVDTLRGNELIYDMYRLAFSAVMVSFSNYSYEPSLGSRPGSGKPLINEADVTGHIKKKLQQINDDVVWARKDLINNASFRIVNESFFHSDLEEESVDLLVTSPPYLNNYHYIRNTRPQLFWLGFVQSSADLKRLETDNYGKYWQTVRERNYKCALALDSPWLKKLLKQISSIEKDRAVYGGEGWANYACEYFNDTVHFLKLVKRCLKKKSKAVIVIGNSVLKGIDVPTDKVFEHVAEELSFRKVKNIMVRDARVGSSIVGSGVRTSCKKRLYESVVEIEK
jgi:DNA modification methylase